MENLNIECNTEYGDYISRWARVRLINNGEAALKKADLSRFGTLSATSKAVKVSFLRPINPIDTSPYNTQRNTNYINGARLYNATVKTLSGLLGMLYRKPPVEAPLPEKIEYIFANVDGSGLSMNQQSRSVSSDVVSIGRDGLLVDMPRNDEGTQLTKADVDNGFRASIQEYKAESVIDWHETVINNAKTLDLLVLRESIEVYADAMRIKRETKLQYKVYRLDDNGVTVQIFTESEDGKGLEETEEIAVTDSTGAALTAIPFTFVGSKNNQSDIDNLPLEPISDINIGHYQESANLASSSFQLSACQPVISDDNYARHARDKKNGGDSVELGEESMIILGSGGKFELVSPPENNLSKSIQKDYEEQMVALGAQLITQGGGVETAEAARIKHASDVSDLEVISSNVSQAYSKCLEWVCLFMGVEYKEEYTYKLNDEFFEMSLTADDAVKLVSIWQGGAISKAVLDENLVKGKLINADEDLGLMNSAAQEEQGASVDFDEPEE
tara:strand:- start:5832 stop:7334 length:1503 start_codon:yes stop_codon:yes gene_type:complete